MTQSTPSAGTPTPAENIARLLGWLRADAVETRLKAFDWLARLPYSSPELLNELERMALADPDERVRQSALAALDSPAARAVYRSTKLPFSLRVELLQQIDRWLMEGQLDKTQAEVLRKRYNFDARPSALSETARKLLPQQVADWLQQGLIRPEQAAQITAPAALTSAPFAPQAAPAAETPAAAPAPTEAPGSAETPVSAETPASAEAPAGARQTALQVIFSEVSIRIALFLGGFLIVAAALILAAILEIARLPILLGLTAAAGLSAAALKRRLPLPGFVLFIIFTCLLPIDARIWADLQAMLAPGVYAYWALIWVGIAVVLAGGTVLFRSRLFSLAALLCLETAAIMLTLSRPNTTYSVLHFFLTVLVGLFGLLGAAALKDWQDWRFARPLFWLSQALVTLALGGLLLVSPAAAFEGGDPGANWLWMAATWLAGALFYLLSDLWVQPFFFFPILTAGALLLLPANFFAYFHLESRWYTAALAGMGLLYTAAGDFLHLRDTRRAVGQVNDAEPLSVRIPRYGLPLLVAAVLLLVWAAGVGLDNKTLVGGVLIDDPTPGFIVLALMALVYALLHAQKRRLGLWLVALFAGLAAYFIFYELPALARFSEFHTVYRLLIASLVLLLPDLLRGPDRQTGKAWSLPARWLGIVVLALSVLVMFFVTGDAGQDWNRYALLPAVSGLLCLGYGLRFRQPWLGYGFTALTALAAGCLLQAAARPEWMLPLAGLALVYALSGWALLRIANTTGAGALQPEILSAQPEPGVAPESTAPDHTTSPGEEKAADPSAAAAAATSAVATPAGFTRRWSSVLRYSALAMGVVLLLRLPFELQAGAGVPFDLSVGPALALLLVAGLWLVELFYSGLGWLEFGMDGLLIAGVVRLVHARIWSAPGIGSPPMLGVDLLLAGLIVLAFDLFFTTLQQDGETNWLPWTKTPGGQRIDSRLAWTPFAPPLRWTIRAIAAALLLANTLYLVGDTHLASGFVAPLFVIQTLCLILAAWLYPYPLVTYLPAASLPLSLFYNLRHYGQEQWLAPLVGLGAIYYLAAYLLRSQERPGGRVEVLRYSGLGLGMLAALAGVFFSTSQGGLFASLPVAAAATLYALEAFRRRNVWLGFPANGLYLLAYYVILYQLKVDQPQYYSVGVAVLGMLMHFLLVRSGNSLAAFITGMVSQCALLGTTYIQMYSTNQLSYFVMLFFQGLIVLAYGIVIRSRSLVFTPLVFIVLGVITVVLTVLSGVPTAIIIGCTGVLLLVSGILAVLMRERLIAVSDRLGERLGGWRA